MRFTAACLEGTEAGVCKGGDLDDTKRGSSSGYHPCGYCTHPSRQLHRECVLAVRRTGVVPAVGKHHRKHQSPRTACPLEHQRV